MKWLKLHTEARTDAKLRTLTDGEHRVWFNLLCYAAEPKDDGKRGFINGVTRPVLAAEVARGRENLLERTIDKLTRLNIVEQQGDRLVFIHFHDRHYEFPSDEPKATASRKRKSRGVTNGHE